MSLSILALLIPMFIGLFALTMERVESRALHSPRTPRLARRGMEPATPALPAATPLPAPTRAPLPSPAGGQAAAQAS